MPMPARMFDVQRILFPHIGDGAARDLYLRADFGGVAWDRDSIRLDPLAKVTLGTYFAAFPAGWWRAHTPYEHVLLRGTVEGFASIRLCAADEQLGRRILVEQDVEGAFAIDVALSEGIWLWLEMDAGTEGATLRGAAWFVDELQPATAAVCITTHDRGEDCLGVLRSLAEDGAVLELIDRIHVVDQGSRPLRQTPGFAAVADELGDRFVLVEQPNLGGSGGFSRGMIDALDGSASHALLLDDDVLLEPESVRRMLAFAAAATKQTIVGAQMLSLTDRTLLHSVGERIDSKDFWWTPVDPALAPVDLAAATIESTPGLRIVRDVDFNGWWMCLVPLQLVRRIGVALPFFIKWDDAEFGLRAAAAGVGTVTLPGAALWHMPWTAKDDGLDWQAYYQLRNRLIAALIHSRSGGKVVSSTLAQDLNHILCMQYGSAAARRTALRDVLSGPSHLTGTIARRTDDIRDVMRRANQTVVDLRELPASVGRGIPSKPVGSWRAARRMVSVVVHQFTRGHSSRLRSVEVDLSRAQGKWWALGLLNSATVASATGQGAFVLRRERTAAVALTRDAVALRLVLWFRWRRLARDYRSAAPGLAAPEAWRDLFDAASANHVEPSRAVSD
jgi:galactofuranosylgalactofuranosylrhamnosyl-N-acetylglucosaminyl-diphospho-decaprenol beta-1,5/1,6-galactofuranosyltransferase